MNNLTILTFVLLTISIISFIIGLVFWQKNLNITISQTDYDKNQKIWKGFIYLSLSLFALLIISLFVYEIRNHLKK